MGVKRLIVCLDGTWNTPEDNTNILRIYQAIGDRQSGADDQIKFYDAGVGTDRRTKLTGGMFGLGLDENVLQAYVWLCRNFVPDPAASPTANEFVGGQDIFVFGFSRGAFTARSLTGLVSRCGLLKKDQFTADDWATEDAMRNSPATRAAWDLYRKKLENGRGNPEAKEFRKQRSHTVRIKFIGVWDTVGALGIPTFRTAALPVRSSIYEFHDLKLSSIVEHAYHAVAIDECREDFNVALWDACGSDQKVEQRWFPGAHANVGGGYEDDRLADISLRWMAEKAAKAGLRFIVRPWRDISKPMEAEAKEHVPAYLELEGDEYEDVVRDSYGEFMYGAYKFVRSLTPASRYYRPIAAFGIMETIDPSAQAKWTADPKYRPRNLAIAGRMLRASEIGS